VAIAPMRSQLPALSSCGPQSQAPWRPAGCSPRTRRAPGLAGLRSATPTSPCAVVPAPAATQQGECGGSGNPSVRWPQAAASRQALTLFCVQKGQTIYADNSLGLFPPTSTNMNTHVSSADGCACAPPGACATGQPGTAAATPEALRSFVCSGSCTPTSVGNTPERQRDHSVRVREAGRARMALGLTRIPHLQAKPEQLGSAQLRGQLHVLDPTTGYPGPQRGPETMLSTGHVTL
jgi:hypothetical protein